MNQKDNEKLEMMRHSCAHVLATAVLELFPEAKFGIGPTIENGFYYDFDLPRNLVPEDLLKIEKRMKKIITRNLPFERQETKTEEATKFFKKLKQNYKLELIRDLKKEGEKKVSIYKTGEFTDLCRGPHVKSTKEIKAFKLTKIAGAYWRGDEKNKMLQRIYGLAFNSQEELESYLGKLEEAERRDHRKLGQELELFMLDEEIGAGLPLWLPKGAILRHIIEDFLYKELVEHGYHWVTTPHIASLNLWKTSGHWGFYRENMYSPIQIDEEQYLLKPMNCPFHVKIYNLAMRSYRDLPVRLAELGTVYRYERSGVLHGLTRVRGFTQDDAHIICTPEQLSDELLRNVKHALQMLKTFGFKDYNIYLSTRPGEYTGTVQGWEKATKTLQYVLKELKTDYQVDAGGGVFYGPKIDIKIKDSLGREWQCTTVQFDFNLPEKFKMTYVDQDGKKKEPYMIHRALLGSMERFIGVLIEHYAGAFPVWLAPVQVAIMPVGSAHLDYSRKLAKEFRDLGIRAEIDDLNETIGYKIRKAEKQKIPYMLVVGDKEMEGETLNVRERGVKEVKTVTVQKFLEKIQKEISEKI